MTRVLSNLIGIDDCPFPRGHRGDVGIVGAVFASERLDGVLTSKIRRDGANATERIAAMIRGSRFDGHIQAVLLQGIAVGGFNVVDLPRLAELVDRPVLVVARRAPRLDAIERALRGPVPGGERKWRLIQRAGLMEPLAGVWVQRAGLSSDEAERLLSEHIRYGSLPEPLRVAHILAGGFATGASRGRA